MQIAMMGSGCVGPVMKTCQANCGHAVPCREENEDVAAMRAGRMPVLPASPGAAE